MYFGCHVQLERILSKKYVSIKNQVKRSLNNVGSTGLLDLEPYNRISCLVYMYNKFTLTSAIVTSYFLCFLRSLTNDLCCFLSIDRPVEIRSYIM